MVAYEVRQARRADVPAIVRLQVDCYPLLSQVVRWTPDHLLRHQAHFPEGQFVAEIDGRIVGHSAAFRISSKVALKPHTFGEITARGTFDRHDPAGDALYGAEIMVHPDLRRQGIAKRFYEVRFHLVRSLGLAYFIAGGRLPGYEDWAEKLSPEDYVGKVVAGKIKDRVLSTQLKQGLRVHSILSNYMPDQRSRGFASLLVWQNPDLARRAVGAVGRPGQSL